MNSQRTILLVDDDPDLINVHTAYLELLGFSSLHAANGKEALQVLSSNLDKIDLILSDVVMPEMDGYDFCHAIKDNDNTKDIPFLFISSHTSLEEKLKGYGAGGDDYISKPIRPEELSHKITTLLDARIKNKQLSTQLAETHHTAMQAMTYSSDLGQILEFYKNSLNAATFEQLATYLFETTTSYDLKVTLQLITPNGTITLTEKGIAPPLESNVIELSRTKGRYFDFGARTVINYDNFSLLIKNMPINDPERYGTIKDTLGTLCNAIESRVRVLITNNTVKKNEEILGTVKSTLQQVEALFEKIQQGNARAIETLSDELEEAMLTSLGLNEHQEEGIRTIAKTCQETSHDVHKEGEVLNEMFETINEQLLSILDVKA